MKITLVPWYKKDSYNGFFEDPKNLQYLLLKQRLNDLGHDFNTIDVLPIKESDAVVFFDVIGKSEFHYVIESLVAGNCKNSIYFALEPPVVLPMNFKEKVVKWNKLFKTVFTIQSQLDGIENFKYYSEAIDKSEYLDANEKIEGGLLTSISGYKQSNVLGELYSEREKAYRFFGEKLPGDFKFYGVGWDSKSFPAYGGKVENKQTVLKQYKFALAYENMDNLDGYITEKPIDVLLAGRIPIYKGAKNIVDYIPKECLIFADDFASYDSLLDYLMQMPSSEYEHRIKCIKEFLYSDAFYRFTPAYFAEKVANAIVEQKENSISAVSRWRIILKLIVKNKLLTIYNRIVKSITMKNKESTKV